MARHSFRIAAAALTVLIAQTAWSQQTPAVPPSESGGAEKEKPRALSRAERKESAELPELAKFLETLPAECRDVVRQKFQEWHKAHPQQKLLKRGAGPEDAKKFADRLPPEQRKKFEENLKRWQNLPPEEREALRVREQVRLRQVNKEIDQVLAQTGLQLNQDRREAFALRYAQERKKIEEQLRKETEEKRGPLVKDLTERLKTEFSAGSPQTSAEKK
jgi:dsDNA-binding SOS-regulon protein